MSTPSPPPLLPTLTHRKVAPPNRKVAAGSPLQNVSRSPRPYIPTQQRAINEWAYCSGLARNRIQDGKSKSGLNIMRTNML
eukprot:3601241-Heterocapsa_arctica.AAC.1